MALKYQSTFTGAQIQQILAAANRFLGVTNPEDREFIDTITDDDYLYLSSGKWINAKKFLEMGGGTGSAENNTVHIYNTFSEVPNFGKAGHIYVILKDDEGNDNVRMYLCTADATYDSLGEVVPHVEQVLTDSNVEHIDGGNAAGERSLDETKTPEEEEENIY